MSNSKSFRLGETYNLKQLFSGDNKIIIPDLQRDYCWGDDSHTEEKRDLVAGFVNNLITLFDGVQSNSNGALNLGLIYGYEAPLKHIQLCDGQQRITTLFLLLGLLNKRSPENRFRSYLISEFEYSQDDKEPYLQYSIRESSLYFLSDLVCHYFIHDEGDLEYVDNTDHIKHSSWFFNEYHTDPSILSMLKAISKIETILSNKNDQWCHSFGDYLVDKLTFMYYDTETRKNGEETFVVINTTGEPLSPTQNLKPLIIANNSSSPDISKRWEEIETWFWRKRYNDNDTADAGFNEFLRWVTLLNIDYKTIQYEAKEILAKGRYSFPKDTISFDNIYTVYKAVKFLFDECKYNLDKSLLSPIPNREADDLRCISQINCFLLLPLIEYCKKWNVTDPDNKGLCRLYHFLKNLTRLANVSKAVNDLVFDAIYIARSYEDIVNVLNEANTISSTILTQEEKLKLHIFKASNNREDVEKTFWDAEQHHIWDGQIMPLIQWATEDGEFSLDKFQHYKEIFNRVFVDECDDGIDIVRRTLLTRNLKGYPRIFRGNTNLSFGWEYSDWKVLINDNTDIFKNFLDEFDGKSLIKDVCQRLIDDFVKSPKIDKTEYAEFIKYPYLMEYCGEKNIQCDDNQGLLLLKRKRTSAPYLSLKCKHLEIYLNSKCKEGILSNEWKISDGGYGTIIIKNTNTNLKIEVHDHLQKWVMNVSSNKDSLTFDIDTGEENGMLIYSNVLDRIKSFEIS